MAKLDSQVTGQVSEQASKQSSNEYNGSISKCKGQHAAITPYHALSSELCRPDGHVLCPVVVLTSHPCL
jgi:hypothetical protein